MKNKRIISVLTVLLIILTVCGCSKATYQTTVDAENVLRLDVNLMGTHGPECAPLIIRDTEQINAFAEFINNAPILKTEPVLNDEGMLGISNCINIYYKSGEIKRIEIVNDSFCVDDTAYTVKSDYLDPLDTSVNNIQYILDFVTVGDFATALSSVIIKTEADREQKYSEVSEPGWNTGALNINAVLTPQNAKETIDAFLKQHFYTLETDVLAELSLGEKTKLTTEDAGNICDELWRKLKEVTPKLALDANAVAKAEISDKSDVENPKSLTVTGNDLQRLVDYLNKTPITSVDYVGIASGIYKSVALFDKDGGEIFRADVNESGFVNGYCQYTADNVYLSTIFDNIK